MFITEIKQIQQPDSKKKNLRVAAYCRVSTAHDAQLESLTTQREHYEKLIAENDNWELVNIYYDEGLTGTKKDKRTALRHLLADCENGHIDYIITKSISRFSRNTTECLEMVRQLQHQNIPVFFEKENINTMDMESELILSILSSLAEDESRSTSENNQWAIRKRFENGTFKISYPPYGYFWDGTEMMVNPDEAEIVKMIFTEFLSGNGASVIAKKLNAMGIPTRKNGKWHPSTINNMLKNEKYIGDALFQKTYTDSYFNQHVNNGDRDQFLCRDHHKAIIDRNDFCKVQELLGQHRKEKNVIPQAPKYNTRYAFSSQIFCSKCGSPFRRITRSCKGYQYNAWVCTKHYHDASACPVLAVKNNDIEYAFITMVNKLIYGRNVILLPMEQSIAKFSSETSIKRMAYLQQKIDQLIEERRTLQLLSAQGYLEQPLFTEQNNALTAQMEAYGKEMDALKRCDTVDATMLQELKRLISFTKHTTAVTEFNEKHFTDFVSRIVVHNQKEITFELKCGLSLREVIP